MAQSIGEELRSFYNFLKYPQQNIFKEHLSVNNFLPLITSYYIVFICGIFVLTPFAALIGLDEMPHKLGELQNWNMWLVLLIAVLTQPFLEELIFRLPLKYHRGLIVLIISLVGLIIFMVLGKFYPTNPQEQIASIRIIIPIGFIVVASLLLFTFYHKEEAIERIRNLVTRYYPHFFYTVAVYFAFVHFYNFEITGNQWLYTPIMVFPQFLMALFVGYSRLKYGFLSAVVIHMINNLIPLVLLFLANPV